jgi:hypothetical protein
MISPVQLRRDAQIFYSTFDEGTPPVSAAVGAKSNSTSPPWLGSALVFTTVEPKAAMA